MKKTLKLVMIFAGGLLAIVISAMTGYFLIAKNKTFYIYDVRLVEPNEGMKGYIYTDSESEYTSIKNKIVYMNNKKSNLCPIAVYASSSSNANDVKITSSDPSIAKIMYQDGGCYVQYLKEGFVTITSELYGVKDSFTIQIFDQIPSEFTVFDYEYYGDYAEVFPNEIVSYADGVEYRYNFYLNNAAFTGSNENIDGDLLEFNESSYDKDVFELVAIDSETNELIVKCKIPEDTRTDNINDIIVLQSFYYDEYGEKVYGEPYKIHVHINLYIPEFLQIEVSSTPDFDEAIVFTNTQIDANFKDNYSNEYIKDNPKVLTNYLSAEKAENYLSKNGEKATYNVFLTDRVKRIYLRPRMVYSNGDIVYLKNGDNSVINIADPSLCKLDPSGDYFIMTLNTTNYFTSSQIISFDIDVSLIGFTLNHKFKFVYKESSNENIRDFYKYDEASGVYTYNYWDVRAEFTNELYDENGKITGFGAWWYLTNF